MLLYQDKKRILTTAEIQQIVLFQILYAAQLVVMLTSTKQINESMQSNSSLAKGGALSNPYFVNTAVGGDTEMCLYY